MTSQAPGIPEDEARNELKRSVKDSIEKAKSIRKRTNEIDQDVTKIQDHGEIFLDAIAYVPPGDLEEKNNLWGLTSHQLSKTYDDLRVIQAVTTTSSGTVSIYVPDLSNVEYYTFDNDNPDQISAVGSIVERFERLTNVKEEFKKATDLIDSLGLNSAREGEMTPKKLLELAYQAYQTPVSVEMIPASTSLLPLRDGINQLLNNLNQRKPEQEKTSNEYNKVSSIVRQLKRDEIEPTYIDILAGNWHALNREKLSTSKTKEVDRSRWGKILFEGLSYIVALLGAIDPNKLRK